MFAAKLSVNINSQHFIVAVKVAAVGSRTITSINTKILFFFRNKRYCDLAAFIRNVFLAKLTALF